MIFEGLYLGNTRRYRLLHVLASGGMSDVYLADDFQKNRQVAIKLVQINTALQTREIQRVLDAFRREIKAITSLDHPFILPVFDYGRQSTQNMLLAYIVMPYCVGGSLETWLDQGNQAAVVHPCNVAHFISEAASALQHAHNRGVIHRDVKPANFLIRNDGQSLSIPLLGGPNSLQLPDLLLADFGIAKLTAISATSSRLFGSIHYMSPERWQGRTVEASDQYALAIMTYELLTGERPFRGTKDEIIQQHMLQSPVPPSRHDRTLSHDIDKVVLHALAKSAEDRFPSVADFATAFEHAVAHSEESRPDSVTVSLTPPTVPAMPRSTIRALPRRSHLSRALPSSPQTVPLRKRALLIVVAALIVFAAVIAYPFIAARLFPPIVISDGLSTPAPVHIGPLVLTDALKDNTQGQRWEEGSDSYGGCQFQSGVYHAIQHKRGNFTTCTARNTDFSNFAYQAQITLVQGNSGGLIFRVQDSPGSCYAFLIARDGSYALLLYVDNTRRTARQLAHGNSSAIRTGINETNLLKVLAHGNLFDLLVNGRELEQAQDPSSQYSDGRIGVIADADMISPAEVTVGAINVWTL